MTRHWFGGGAADVVWQVGAGGSVRVIAAEVNLYSTGPSKAGGLHYTDLLDESGNPIAQLRSDANGQVRPFQGPDGVTVMWADGGGPNRVRFTAWDSALVAGVTVSRLTVRAEPGQTEPPLEVFDEFGNPIATIPIYGGFSSDGDNIRVLPPGDVFNSVVMLRKDGSGRFGAGDLGGAVGGALALGDVTTPPNTVPDGSHVIESENSRAGVVIYSTNGIPRIMRRSGTTDEIGVATERRQMVVAKNGGAATVSSHLTPAVTVTGAASNYDIPLSCGLVKLETAATTGDFAGVFPATYTQLFAAWQPMMHVQLVLGDTVSSVRHWAGLFSVDPHAVGGPGGIHCAAFRYDSSLDSTPFWRCVTSDASGTPTITTTTIPVTASGAYRLRIEWTAANNAVRFLAVNPSTGLEVVVATHTTHLPVYNQYLAPVVSCTALAASVRAVMFSRYAVTHVG